MFWFDNYNASMLYLSLDYAMKHDARYSMHVCDGTCWIASFQISFDGLTGHVQFDKRGYRKDYKLDIVTVSLDTGPHKVTLLILSVCLFAFCVTTSICVFLSISL